MSSSSRQLLHLGRHFSLLTEHLKSLWDEIDLKEEERANEIRIIFKDGIRHIHRVVLATLSPSLKKVLLALDSSPGQIQVPDSSVVEGEHLLRLIYTGGTTLRDEATVEKLHDLSDSFKFKSLSVVKDYINLEEEEEEGGKKEGTLPHEEEELPMLTISEVPTKKVAKTVKRKRVTATEATKVDPSPEEGGSVRRSKRPKVKSKRFRDYEVQPGKEFIKEEEELASKDTRGVPEISSPRGMKKLAITFCMHLPMI